MAGLVPCFDHLFYKWRYGNVLIVNWCLYSSQHKKKNLLTRRALLMTKVTITYWTVTIYQVSCFILPHTWNNLCDRYFPTVEMGTQIDTQRLNIGPGFIILSDRSGLSNLELRDSKYQLFWTRTYEHIIHIFTIQCWS